MSGDFQDEIECLGIEASSGRERPCGCRRADRVNHDRLMAAVAARVADRRLLRLIRSYLTAGALDNGLFEDSREGTPPVGMAVAMLYGCTGRHCRADFRHPV